LSPQQKVATGENFAFLTYSFPIWGKTTSSRCHYECDSCWS